MSVLTTVLGIWMIGHVGRRRLLMLGLVVVVATQLALGLILQELPQGLMQSFLALASILVFLLFMQMCISPVYWLLMSELFPNNVRGILSGVAVSSQWLFNALVAFLFPMCLGYFGEKTFYAFAALNMLSLIFVTICLPETKGKSLVEIERIMRKEL